MIFCDVPRFPVIQDVSRPLLSHLFGGKDTKAGGEETNASGEGTRASGEDTRAGGEGTRASGEDTRAAGEDTRAGNDDTRALSSFLPLLPPHVSSSFFFFFLVLILFLVFFVSSFGMIWSHPQLRTSDCLYSTFFCRFGFSCS